MVVKKRKRNLRKTKKNIKKTKMNVISKKFLRERPLRIANIISKFAIFFLVFQSFFILLMNKSIIALLNENNIKADFSLLLLLAILWVMIAVFAYSINRKILLKRKRVYIWELLIFAVIAILSGRWDSGVLLIISSMIYLKKIK